MHLKTLSEIQEDSDENNNTTLYNQHIFNSTKKLKAIISSFDSPVIMKDINNQNNEKSESIHIRLSDISL